VELYTAKKSDKPEPALPDRRLSTVPPYNATEGGIGGLVAKLLDKANPLTGNLLDYTNGIIGFQYSHADPTLRQLIRWDYVHAIGKRNQNGKLIDEKGKEIDTLTLDDLDKVKIPGLSPEKEEELCEALYVSLASDKRVADAMRGINFISNSSLAIVGFEGSGIGRVSMKKIDEPKKGSSILTLEAMDYFDLADILIKAGGLSYYFYKTIVPERQYEGPLMKRIVAMARHLPEDFSLLKDDVKANPWDQYIIESFGLYDFFALLPAKVIWSGKTRGSLEEIFGRLGQAMEVAGERVMDTFSAGVGERLGKMTSHIPVIGQYMEGEMQGFVKNLLPGTKAEMQAAVQETKKNSTSTGYAAAGNDPEGRVWQNALWKGNPISARRQQRQEMWGRVMEHGRNADVSKLEIVIGALFKAALTGWDAIRPYEGAAQKAAAVRKLRELYPAVLGVNDWKALGAIEVVAR
jgi:hypothetical protein